jgi:hypothetical protein
MDYTACDYFEGAEADSQQGVLDCDGELSLTTRRCSKVAYCLGIGWVIGRQ